MKKNLLLLVLPLLALGACKAQEPVEPVEPEPIVEKEIKYYGLPVVRGGVASSEDHVTYLLMSPFGYIEQGGTKIEGGIATGTYYENAYAFPGDYGDTLPVAKSSVPGATFRGWYYYDENNDHVWPDKYEKVPSKYGLALKAIFDGTNAGGNSGSGTGGGSSGGGTSGGGSATTSAFGIKKGNDDIVLGSHIGMNFEGYDEWLVSSVSFTAGETFEMYDSGSQVSWKIPSINPYSFGADGDASKVSQYLDASTYTMQKDCTVDIYIQLQYENDRVYFELK